MDSIRGGGEDQDEGIRLTWEPSDAVVAAGESTVLNCAAVAGGVVRIAWRHSAQMPTREHAVSANDKYRKQLPNGSLVIENMSASTAGQYQCVASVDGIGTIVSRLATVFLAELPEVSGGARSVLGVLGGPVLLPCGLRAPPRLALRVLSAGGAPDRRVYGASKVHIMPPTLKLNVTWLKNGSPVRLESARVAITPSGALEIEPLRAHDAASYRCRVALASHPQLYKTSEEMELRVNADVAGTESPPRFIATPQPATVMEGASVTFDCAAVGNPKPEMSWLNNGVAIDLSDLDSRFYLAGSGSLRVQSARALDAGAYTCRAHNRLDSADHTTQLHVLSAPRVQLPSGPLVAARTRGDVTLRCEARGRPPPRVRWLKDGEPLSPNQHDIALVDGTSLRIQGVLLVDAGMFQCFASSAAGSAHAALRLKVAPPDLETNGTQKTYTKSTQDIFNTLVSSPLADPPPDPEPSQNLDRTGDLDSYDDLDLDLGETSSAYTPQPIYDNSYTDVYDNNLNFLHAAKDLDVSRQGNESIVSVPRGLKAVIVKHRFVTLSWEEPETKNEEIQGYAVVYKVKGSERERVSRGGPSKHEMNVASLQPNTTYQFAILAFTEHAVSPPSQIIEVTTPEEELTYGPPTNVRAEAVGPHAVRVSWSPPAAPTPPAKYSVHYSEAESGREQFQYVDADLGGDVVATTLSGLRAATAYWLRVAAAGGAPAGELRVRTPSDVPAAPPANVSAVSTGATNLTGYYVDLAPSTEYRNGDLHNKGYLAGILAILK
ncbi:netrin receptor DCC-like [Hyposmocoma kahamanoa]|uniref:netrin receptor DCC-like n=1 Tax=Hyposmocoma kahamanoa TaxID=1477025 RepID=UPI000E6D8A93|nr:netrin receptor DCC-like [Hyposmocoma kahamanoa]